MHLIRWPGYIPWVLIYPFNLCDLLNIITYQTMKKYIILVAVTILFCSCEEDFLGPRSDFLS